MNNVDFDTKYQPIDPFLDMYSMDSSSKIPTFFNELTFLSKELESLDCVWFLLVIYYLAPFLRKQLFTMLLLTLRALAILAIFLFPCLLLLLLR